ncbi:MAG: class B sortase [Oscillospiraceae bacterium]|nr:class B sortase [Oscillospiraceae bacterium]
MKKGTKILLIVLCVVCLLVAAISAYRLISILGEYNKAVESYEDMSDSFVNAEPAATPVPTEAPVGEEVASAEPAEPEAPAELSPITVDFEALLATNEDVVGWIYSKDTVINYPIAQGEDNDEYLHHLLDGTYNSSGTLFVDCECAPEFAGANTIVYGHNMKNGSMFYSLLNYREQSYYDAHPVMYLNTPSQNYRIDVFSGYICNYDSDTYTLSFPSEEDYVKYQQKMKSQSDFNCDVELAPTDRVITLSTCTYEYDNARYVVQGKLVPLDG